MPINPGPYEPENFRGTGGVRYRRGGEAPGGSLQQGYMQPVKLGRSPAIENMAGLIENVGAYFQATADAEAKLAKAKLDADVDMAHQRIRVGQDLISQELKRNGDYAKDPRAYVRDWNARQAKLLKDQEASIDPAGHRSLAKKAYADVLQGRFHAIQYSDELMKVHQNERLEGWERMSVETAAKDPTNDVATISGERWKDYFNYADTVDQMIATIGLPRDKAEQLKLKARHEAVRSYTHSLLREDPQLLSDRLQDKRNEVKGWLSFLPEAEQTSFLRQARERVNEQDRLATQAEEKRKKALEDDATRTLTELLVTDGNLNGARAQLNYYRTVARALDDTTWRTWDSLLTAAEDRSKKGNPDPWVTLAYLAEPEKADLGSVARDWQSGRVDEATAKQIIVAKRTYLEKMKDRNWSEAVRESREIINRTFGYSPFLEFRNDPRAQAHLQAITEFNDGSTRLDSPDQIKVFREEVLKRQGPVMKIGITDRLESLRRSIPAYQKALGVEENFGLFEANVRSKPSIYSPERIQFYRKTFREIMQWESVLDSQGAADHGRTPGGTDKAPTGGQRKY